MAQNGTSKNSYKIISISHIITMHHVYLLSIKDDEYLFICMLGKTKRTEYGGA